MVFIRHVSLKANLKICYHYTKRSSHNLSVELSEPQYPPIFDASKEGLLRHERQLFYDSVQKLPTVEQKLHAIVSKRGFFKRTYLLNCCPPTYLSVPFTHYITRTHLIQNLPQRIESSNVDQDYEALKPQLCLAVAKHFSNSWRETKLNGLSEFLKENECGSKLINELTVLIFRSLAWKNKHMLTAVFDPRCRIHSFWWHGGFTSKRDDLDEKNICFHYGDFPYFIIRTENPLTPIVPLDDPLCATAEVIDYNYHPRCFGYPYSARHYISSVPGFWPGDPCEFPFLQFQTLDRLESLTNKLEHFNMKDVENSFGITASFGWLNALATYQGFTPYHDLTYPLVGQLILTNGQDWCFFIYQLNTITFHTDLDKKDRRNLCWSSGRMRLFETIENGEIKGLNDEVFKTLLKLMLHAPEAVDKTELKPYLGEDTRTEEEIKSLRLELRRFFYDSPPIKPFKYDIPFWHHIYKRNRLAPPCPWIKLR